MSKYNQEIKFKREKETKTMFDELNNKRITVREGVDINSMEFKPIKDFVGQDIRVDGFFFTTGGHYGKQVVVVGNGCLINMPKRAVETFEVVVNNGAMLNAVLGGHMLITDIKPIKTKNGDSTGYTFKDC